MLVVCVKDDHINEKWNRRMELKDKLIQDLDSKITADTVFFFDMDGTLVVTNLANFLSYKKAVQSVTKSNHDLTYNSNKRFNRSCLKNAIPNLSENEYERIIQEKEEYYNDFLTETKLNVEIAEMEKGLGYLGLISGIAPILGFIGTISGVIKIFHTISNTGNLNIQTISGGLYEKMISSGAGLVVGVVAYSAYHLFNMMIDQFSLKVQKQTLDIINVIQQP